MKKLVLLFALSFATLFAFSQSVLRYEFVNTLTEKNGSGPELTVLGNPGNYVLDTLNEISGNTKTVYRFERNSGFQFDNEAAGNFIGDNYTIELYFVFDELDSWNRVVDWKNRKTDYGAYVYYGELNFYPYINSYEAPVVPGEYTYYVITRDASTNQLYIYTDADIKIDFVDSNNDAMVDTENLVNFFHDDYVVPNEASSGAVALLNIYNYVLDSTVIKENFENIGGQVFAVNEIRKSLLPMSLYPNPAVDRTTIDLAGFAGEEVEISVVNASGREIFRESLSSAASNELMLDVSGFAAGIYLVRAESASRYSTQKMIVHQE